MVSKQWRWILATVCLLASSAWGQASFGTRVVINGQSADLALDEARRVLYVANFGGSKIDVIGLDSLRVERSINLDLNQPASVSVSPDSRFLLVAHYGNNTPPASSTNGLTLIDLNTNARRTYSLASAPLGVAFGADGRALVATATGFQLFDPQTGTFTLLSTISGLTPTQLPVVIPNFPTTITRASVAASADGMIIGGLSDTFTFIYDLRLRRLNVVNYVSTPLQAPRAVSLSRDGSLFASGWFIDNLSNGRTYQFPAAGGTLNLGSHVIDSQRNLIYAQIREQGETASTGPNNRVLQVLDAANLAVRRRLQLPENLTGKAVMSSDSNFAYALSESGVVALPVGSLDRTRQLEASPSFVSFRGNFCDRRLLTREITIRDTSGAQSRFSLSTSSPGVSISPSSGVTPQTVRVTVDPNSYAVSRGTTIVNLAVTSPDAVNLIPAVQLAINTREPDQRGVTVDLPGTLVAIEGDSQRNRFYILRQDTSEVLVYNANNLTQIAALKTGTTPTSLAITYDRSRLLIGHDNSQFVEVYNLDTLESDGPILSPFGHYPRQIGVSAAGVLIANRVAGPINTIDMVDFVQRRAVQLSSLGAFVNSINLDTGVIASSNGSSVVFAQPTGALILYKDGQFVSARQIDGTSFAGALGASNYDTYVIGNQLFNGSLTPIGQLANGATTLSGVVFQDQNAIVTSSSTASGPGVIQRVDGATGDLVRPTRTVESPTLSGGTSVFTKNLISLPTVIVSLTTSGFTVFEPNYDAATVPPSISQVTNAADFGTPIAPGGLISIFGSKLSPASQASTTLPLPTILGDSCLTVNGLPVPVLFVSDGQINAQLPAQAVGRVSLVLRTPGGVSDSFLLTVAPGAPSVFRSGSDGSRNDLPTIIRADNGLLVTGSNPVRQDGRVVIYLTGLGATSPQVADGTAAPLSPLAQVVTVPTVTIGGVGGRVEFAGLTPGSVGVYQINVYVPPNTPTGLSVPLVIRQGTNSTTVDVRVVK